MADRDNFSDADKNILGSQVGWRCSNPGCRAHTKGPHSDDARAVHVGVAAHIHAAAPGGPRYDPLQTPEQRASIENGLYLCELCAARIDKDAARYTPDTLRDWKATAKEAADKDLGKPAAFAAVATSIIDRLAAIPSGAVARLVYYPQGSGDYVHDKFQVEVIGVDHGEHVLRFKSLSGTPGSADSMPVEDIERTWVHDDGTRFIRISGYMDFTALQPHRYVSRPARTTGASSPLPPVPATSTLSSVPPMTAHAEDMMRLVGDEYEKSRFPPIQDWVIDGLSHEQKLKFELQAVGLLTIAPDGSCRLTAAGKDWIMWHRRLDAPSTPLMHGGRPVPGFGDEAPLMRGGREVRGFEQVAGEADTMSRPAKAAMSHVMNAYEREGFPEHEVYHFPYAPAADELRALGLFKEVRRDSAAVSMELTDEGRRWIMAHRAR